MRTRGLALGMVLAIASVSQAGTQIRLVPQNVSSNLLNPLGHYLPGEVVNVNVYAVQTPAGPDHLLRLAKFHFDATSPQLTIGSVMFGAYSATGHYVDSSLTTGPAGIAAAYTFVNAASLGPNPANQLALPGNGTPALVGSFTVTMPAAAGAYTLDVVNAGGANTDVRAAITYGFGCTAPDACAAGHADGTFPVTTDRPGAGLTGGTLQLVTNTPTVLVAGVPAIPPQGAIIRVTHPLDGGNLWRTAGQVIRIAFTQDIGVVGNLPSCPAIEIRELTAGPIPATGANFAGGVLGANLNVGAAFSCGIEADPNQANAPRILRITDATTADLSHRRWYTVQNVGGWTGAAPFRMDYRLMAGDADNNGLVNATDVGNVNTNVAPFNAMLDQKRADIDGNRIVNATDVGAANSNVPMGGFFAKPAGHP